MTTPEMWFVGDPHGELRPVTRLAVKRRPIAVIFLGDLQLPVPLEQAARPFTDVGVPVFFIHGNHDADGLQWWNFLNAGPLGPALNLHGHVETIAGLRVAGLGGVFRGRVWVPPEAPRHASYDAMARSLEPSWRTAEQRKESAAKISGQRLTHKGTIFPDSYSQLAAMEADVLVTHEAPGGEGMHRFGFEAIGDLAELMGARRAFHGHHHEYVRYPLRGGVQWIGVGMRQIVDLNGNEIR